MKYRRPVKEEIGQISHSTMNYGIFCTIVLFSSRNFAFSPRYDMIVHWKSTQIFFRNKEKFLPRMLFHKNIRGFSSLLNIYKIPSMRYNIGAVGKCRQVPSVAHCKDRSAKCQAHDISAQKRHDRCAILFLSWSDAGKRSVSAFPAFVVGMAKLPHFFKISGSRDNFFSQTYGNPLLNVL